MTLAAGIAVWGVAVFVAAVLEDLVWDRWRDRQDRRTEEQRLWDELH